MDNYKKHNGTVLNINTMLLTWNPIKGVRLGAECCGFGDEARASHTLGGGWRCFLTGLG